MAAWSTRPSCGARSGGRRDSCRLGRYISGGPARLLTVLGKRSGRSAKAVRAAVTGLWRRLVYPSQVRLFGAPGMKRSVGTLLLRGRYSDGVICSSERTRGRCATVAEPPPGDLPPLTPTVDHPIPSATTFPVSNACNCGVTATCSRWRVHRSRRCAVRRWKPSLGRYARLGSVHRTHDGNHHG